MRCTHRCLLIAGVAMTIGGGPLSAQHLHVNDEWEDCAIVLDPSLTQESWHQFASELGVVTYFRPLTSARPLGARKVELALLQWSTRIDDRDDAWNDTFSHPSSEHPLVRGDALPIPGVMLRVGLSDRMDVGAYATKNFRSNYGIAGAQVQYALLNDPDRKLAAASRLSVARLFGPEDMTASVYGLELVVSRDVWLLSPYAAVSGLLSTIHERTSKVELDDEGVLGAQATVGVAANVSVLRLGAEYTFAEVPGYSFKVAFGT